MRFLLEISHTILSLMNPRKSGVFIDAKCEYGSVGMSPVISQGGFLGSRYLQIFCIVRTNF